MTRSLMAVAVVALCACPPPVPTPDGGDDSGINPNPIDACSGHCAVNQVCDPDRVCRDGCAGTCDGGTFCQKVDAGVFSCTAITTTCGTTLCDPGQVACLGGGCTCLGPERGVFDSCFGDPRDTMPGMGATCNPATGTCRSPNRYEQCKPGTEPCVTGSQCFSFNDTLAFCLKPCMQHTECDRGELCSGSTACLPAVFVAGGQECAIQVDGGVDDAGMPTKVFQTVTTGSICLNKDATGNPTEVTPTGTCLYSFLYYADNGPRAIAGCFPPGAVAENGACKIGSLGRTDVAVQCSTGLDCAGMRSATNGICLRTCNALPPSVTYPNPKPACGVGESCVNLYRQEDVSHDGALLGVCTKKCNIFDPALSQCPNYGSVPSVCIPTNADGRVVVTSDGSGICVPQRETTAMLDAQCAQSDPFKGAACASGQICPPAGVNVAPVCTKICDTTCNPLTDGGTLPARCSSEVNATCPTGKICRSVTSTSGARVGFCQD